MIGRAFNRGLYQHGGKKAKGYVRKKKKAPRKTPPSGNKTPTSR
jgi:hypothetical protein